MRSWWQLGLVGMLCGASWVQAAAPRVLPEGARPDDLRLKPQRNLNEKLHPWSPPATKVAWEAEAKRLREQLLIANGLYPMPEKTPITPVVTKKYDRGDYTVENVYFASRPGHYVTGSLYRPKKLSGKAPGVLCPHGHWPNGRFYDAGDKGATDQLATSAEDFLSGAHSPLQARFVQLARMGCIVFHYDMVGYADSQAIPHSEGFNDAEASLRLQNKMGLQTWNSIRSLDYILSLPDVDADRIGVTGASGGGTQTFMLCAVDPRPAVAFPAVMVSSNMQGGCVCENAEYLRLGINNVAIAALTAPRPLGMVGADDWTIDIETSGLPELKQVYGFYGASDLVAAKTYKQFPHNYNQRSRELMYQWFATHLKLGSEASVHQSDFWPLTKEQLAVFHEKYPVPADALNPVDLRKRLSAESDSDWTARLPKTKVDLATYRAEIRPFLGLALDRGLPEVADLAIGELRTVDAGDLKLLSVTVGRLSEGSQLPVTAVYHPDRFDGRIAFWFDGAGKNILFGADGQPTESVRRLTAAGYGVASADLFLTGEFLKTGETASYPVSEKYDGYTFGYNRPLLSHRVRDVLTLVRAATANPDVKSIDLIGTGDAGLVVLLARSTFDDGVRRTVADLGGFAFGSIPTPSDPRMLPGALKYGGVSGLTITAASGVTELYGCTDANSAEMTLWRTLAPEALHSELLDATRVTDQLLK
ncbi:MAG: hypothetical protein DWH91_16980 [Planctomycetota bacterium]|nr:MAG: hypothetical protein DWH91_16980 [Planctomycetota bacterium]